MPVQTARLKKLRLKPYDGQALKRLLEAGLTWLRTNQQTVNALNVFPVPDGDTGTNMMLTMTSAWNEIKDSGEKHVGRMAAMIAKGALMGARGNSGVILSQLWRGFARGLQDSEVIDGPGSGPRPGRGPRHRLQGRGQARGGHHPHRGQGYRPPPPSRPCTETQDPIAILEQVVAAADASVEHTPELLPVLKQAGVVDSGGKGLFYILEGALRHVLGQPLDTPLATVQPLSALNLDAAMQEVEEGQDYEVVVDFFPEQAVRAATSSTAASSRWAPPSRSARARACTACTSTCRSTSATSRWTTS